MIRKKEILPFRRLGRTRRSSRRNRGRIETSLHFSETVFKENHLLESIEWVR
jgi:hypothetical protein